MHLNANHPIDSTPTHQLEFLENMYHDREKNNVRVVWFEDITGQEAFKDLSLVDPKQFLIDCLSLSQLFLDRENFATDAYLKKLKFKFEPSLTPGFLECSMEAAPYFGLPNKNPLEELMSVREFLYDIKDIFSDYYAQFPATEKNLRFHYTNANGKSNSGFEFAKNSLPEAEQSWLSDKEEHLKERINQDRNLQLWAKHTYSLLQKIGHHPWCNFSTESFFDEASDPYALILKNILAQKITSKKTGVSL